MGASSSGNELRLDGGAAVSFRDPLPRMLLKATRNLPRYDFLASVTGIVIDQLQCDRVELGLRKGDREFRCETVRTGDRSFRFRGGFGPMSDATEDWPSVVRVRLVAGDENTGFLSLFSRRPGFFTQPAEVFQDIAGTLGIVLARQRAEWATRERVKELTCLYGVAQVFENPGTGTDAACDQVAALLPPAWQYPEVAIARVVLDGQVHGGPEAATGAQSQRADIVVAGAARGFVEVSYAQERPEIDEGCFLAEEHSLIHEVARQMARFVERRQVEDDKARLEERLRTADRLASLGRFAAGVAHELNEPLNAILGFAQLAGKAAGVPEASVRDMDKVVKATLHAREVVRQVLLFARQAAPRKAPVDLDVVVRDALAMVEPRRAERGVEVRCDPCRGPSTIAADEGQLRQVVVNLVVNAIQATSEGGHVSVRVSMEEGQALLVVEDDGIGMDEASVRHLFVPFYTTKEIGQGTGLGLAVAHGIVTTHGGDIRVRTRAGSGMRFEVRLPVE